MQKWRIFKFILFNISFLNIYIHMEDKAVILYSPYNSGILFFSVFIVELKVGTEVEVKAIKIR